jgi:hypothetical protein
MQWDSGSAGKFYSMMHTPFHENSKYGLCLRNTRPLQTARHPSPWQFPPAENIHHTHEHVNQKSSIAGGFQVGNP